MKRPTLSFAVLMLLVPSFLMGCDDDDKPDNSTDPHGDGDGDSGGPGDGDGDSGGPGDGDGDGDSGEVDPYCVSAWRGLAALNEFVEAMSPLSLNPDLDLATLNAQGALAAEAAEDTGAHFSRAQEFVVDSDVHTAFDQILAYQELWMVPQADLALNANNVEQYHTDSANHVFSPGVAQVVADGALASGVISSYTLERCGSTEAP